MKLHCFDAVYCSSANIDTPVMLGGTAGRLSTTPPSPAPFRPSRPPFSGGNPPVGADEQVGS